MEHILSMIGLAHKAGRVEIGEEPVGGAARAKKSRVILVAQDAAASSQRRAMSFANAGACLCLTVPADKDALGRALGRTSCAMCAVTDIGFADAIVKKLAALDPVHYAAASAALELKAKRAAERKAEQLRHEKNLKNGKKRSHESAPQEPAKVESPAKTGTRTSRPAKSQRRKPKVDSRQRFEGSRPVKKGKGSKK